MYGNIQMMYSSAVDKDGNINRKSFDAMKKQITSDPVFQDKFDLLLRNEMAKFRFINVPINNK
jgi:hypothetical protein